MDALLSEKVGIKTGFLGDLTGGQSSQRISLQKGYKLAVIIHLASAAFDLDVTFNQHDAPSAGNSKVLSHDNPYYKKVGAATKFTKVEQSVAASQIVDTDLNGAAGVVVFELLAEDLDRDNDFNHISVDIAQAAGARVACVELALHDMTKKPAYSEDL